MFSIENEMESSAGADTDRVTNTVVAEEMEENTGEAADISTEEPASEEITSETDNRSQEEPSSAINNIGEV